MTLIKEEMFMLVGLGGNLDGCLFGLSAHQKKNSNKIKNSNNWYHLVAKISKRK